MTRRYGRIPKGRHAAMTLTGVTAYQPMTMKAMRPEQFPPPLPYPETGEPVPVPPSEHPAPLPYPKKPKRKSRRRRR